jgi:hypothetical protein
LTTLEGQGFIDLIAENPNAGDVIAQLLVV